MATATQAPNLNSSAALKFGSREGSTAFLNGRIDEVTLFSRALSDAEILSVAGGVSIPGPVTVTLNAAAVADEWGNLNESEAVSFLPVGSSGTVYYAAEPDLATVAPRLARSAVGSPFLFHGQYFDYDSGLIYLRARFYDPFSGMFFEPDPKGYADSVNLYAVMANNPVTFRDPTGASIFERLFGRFWRRPGTAKAADLSDIPADKVAGRIYGPPEPIGARPSYLDADAYPASGLAKGYPESKPPNYDLDFTASPRSAAAPEPPKLPKYKTKEMDPGYIGEEIPRQHWNGVRYLTESQRELCRVTVRDGKLYNFRGVLVDSASAKTAFSKGKAIFVMDEFGNIYLSPTHIVGEFHHSSFLAGRGVAAAGEIVVEQGVIKAVTRKSGHYKPGPEFLDQFVSELTDLGVDLRNVHIGAGF